MSSLPRTSRLSVYVTVYLSLCLLSNFALVVVFLGGFPWSSNSSSAPADSLPPPPPSAQEWDVAQGHTLGCADLPLFTNLTLIGSGWTKIVYSSEYGGVRVAVKTVHTTGHDMTECVDTPDVCYQRSAEKIIKETHLLRVLAHPNVVKVYGECVPGVSYRPGPPAVGVVVTIAELGKPVNVLQVLQMTYDQRLHVARDVGRLLLHLAQSPLGPVLMKDFRREQFVMVRDSLKLSDVDDVMTGDPLCPLGSSHCRLTDPATDAVLVKLACVDGACRGYNSRLNALQAGQHLLRLLLPYGGPLALEPPAMDLMARLALGQEDSEGLHLILEDLVANYSKGHYLTHAQRSKLQEFKKSEGMTVRGCDFPCTKTSTSSCQQSVSSPEEAAWLCWQWHPCVAYVLLPQWTWTGRQMAVFKNGVKDLQETSQETLYIRRGQG